jgi:hypothetical protein
MLKKIETKNLAVDNVGIYKPVKSQFQILLYSSLEKKRQI